jgi:hypothetical protein
MLSAGACRLLVDQEPSVPTGTVTLGELSPDPAQAIIQAHIFPQSEYFSNE